MFSDEIICTHMLTHRYTQRGRHRERKTVKDRGRERQERQSDRENKLALQNMVVTACYGGPQKGHSLSNKDEGGHLQLGSK